MTSRIPAGHAQHVMEATLVGLSQGNHVPFAHTSHASVMMRNTQLPSQRTAPAHNHIQRHRASGRTRRPFRSLDTGRSSRSYAARSVAMEAPSGPWPPHAALQGAEPGSFAEATITQRLPAILASTISDLEAQIAPSQGKGEQIRQLVSEVRALRDEIIRAGPVTPPKADNAILDALPANVHSSITATQQALETWQARMPNRDEPHTWLTLPWLLVECVMYVRLAAATARQPALSAAGFDMFSAAKRAAWDKCTAAAVDLAVSYQQLETQRAAASPGGPAALKLAMAQVVQWSLWGNKTDLSLLVNASSINPTSTGKLAPGALLGEAHDAANVRSANRHVIVDEFEAAWGCLTAPGAPRRVHIVLDNAGLELYGDLILADFLVQRCGVEEVVLHGKPFGWFVSDVVRTDFTELIEACGPLSRTPPGVDGASWEHVRRLGARWEGHLAAGRWTYTEHWFWVTPLPFCQMAGSAPDLWAALGASALVVLKGDLNYRKLVHDCRWPPTTPLEAAVQGFRPAPLLALRTLKADVVVGLKLGQAEELQAQDPQWLVNGRWGMVQALP